MPLFCRSGSPDPDPIRDQALPNYRGRVCVPNYSDEALFSVGQERLILTPFGSRRSRTTGTRATFPNPFAIRRSRTTEGSALFSVGQDRLILTPFGSARSRTTGTRAPFPNPFAIRRSRTTGGRVCVPNYSDEALFSVGQERLLLTPRSGAGAPELQGREPLSQTRSRSGDPELQGLGPLFCRSRAPALDPFAIRRSRTTGAVWAIANYRDGQAPALR